MAPSVSVIVPTYDRWPMVRDAVESLISQSCRDFEIIVVDDGSRDGTGEKLAPYGPYIRVIRQAKQGVAAARNLGVRSSGGKYLAFLDSDDLWEPRKLEIQLGFMEANPQIRICQTEEIWLRRGIRVNPRSRHRKPSGDIFRPSLDLCLVSPSAVMLTRELFEEVGGFDEAFPVCEDYDLWLRIALITPVILVPRPVVVKRGGHEDQLSRSTWGLDRYRIMALVKLLRAGVDGERRKWVCEALRNKAGILAHGARRRGRSAEARSYERLVDEFTGRWIHDRREDITIRQRKGVSPADP